MSSTTIVSWVDPYELAKQIGEWDTEEIVQFVKDIDRYRCDDEVTTPLHTYFTEVVTAAELEDASPPEVKWPMTMDDSAIAIHETIERGNCEANNPYNCLAVNHYAIDSVIKHYHTWLKHRGVDVVEQLASRGIRSKEVGRDS